MDQNSITIPLLATASTRRSDRSAAFWVVFIAVCCAIAGMHYSERLLPKISAFIPIYDTGLAVLNLITGMMLIGQVRQVGRLSLLVLGCGYFTAAIFACVHLAAFPEMLPGFGLWRATTQRAGWIYIFWHAVLMLSALSFTILAASRLDAPIPKKRQGVTILSGIAISIFIAVACIFTATALDILPVIVKANTYSLPKLTGSGVPIGLVCSVALALLYKKAGMRNVLSLWICVVLVIWLAEIILAVQGSRQLYDVGWYLSRLYDLAGACVVLSALLIETGALYARLSQLVIETSAQSIQLSKSEAALRQAQKMEAIGQMTGGIAHDFNNLLTVIIGTLDIIQRKPDDHERAARLAGHAMAAASRGAELTKQLLTFSRRQVTRPQTINPNRLIHDFDALMRQAIGEAIEIRLKLDPAIASVRVDPAQFEAAILNLAVNARDAMSGQGVIAIETRTVHVDDACTAANPEAEAGDYVMVALSDTGAGMDEETVSRVFEPFFTTKEVGKGSGLGLSQVYGFVRGANGFVTIESKPGAGTKVMLFFPRAQAEPDIVAENTLSASGAQRFFSETVLIVEDEPAVLSVAVDIMTELGCTVQTAHNAQAALLLIRSTVHIDILFSDVMMPGGMNGVELAMEARKIRPDIKILLTSGYPPSVLKTGPLPDGMDFIPKPYKKSDLEEKLAETLKQIPPAA